MNDAAEIGAFALAKVTALGPETVVQVELSVLPYGNPSSLAAPLSFTAVLPSGRSVIESMNASLVAPVLRVAIKRKRIQPVPNGTMRVSLVRCQALVETISPES